MKFQRIVLNTYKTQNFLLRRQLKLIPNKLDQRNFIFVFLIDDHWRRKNSFKNAFIEISLGEHVPAEHKSFQFPLACVVTCVVLLKETFKLQQIVCAEALVCKLFMLCLINFSKFDIILVKYCNRQTIKV